MVWHSTGYSKQNISFILEHNGNCFQRNWDYYLCLEKLKRFFKAKFFQTDIIFFGKMASSYISFYHSRNHNYKIVLNSSFSGWYCLRKCFLICIYYFFSSEDGWCCKYTHPNNSEKKMCVTINEVVKNEWMYITYSSNILKLQIEDFWNITFWIN